MLELVNDWHDWWRVALLILSTVIFGLLCAQMMRCKERWNEKDRDRWFMKMMWALAAWFMQVEGMVSDAPLRFRLVFVTAALLVMLRLQTKHYEAHA